MHISEVVLIQGGRDAKACAAGTHDNRGYPHLWRYCCECPGSRHPTNSRWSDDAAAKPGRLPPLSRWNDGRWNDGWWNDGWWNDGWWNDGPRNDGPGLRSWHDESHGDANNFQSDGR